MDLLADGAGDRAAPRCGAATSSPASRTRRRPASPTTRATTRRRSTSARAVRTTRRRSSSGAPRRGRAASYRGLGLSTYVEICGLAPSAVTHAIGIDAGRLGDRRSVRLHPTGTATVITGTSPHGQGHATSWSQIVESELGIPFDDVEVIHGDTAYAPYGLGTYGSRARWRSAAPPLYQSCGQGAREGPADRRAHARGVARRPRVRRRHAGRSRARPTRASSIQELAVPRLAGASTCPRAWSRTSTRRRSSTRRTSRSRSAPTSPRSRSTARPGKVDDRALHRRRRLRQRRQPDDRRRPGARRHRPVDRPRRCTRRPSTTTTGRC